MSHNWTFLKFLFYRPLSKVKWRSREGLVPDEVVYLPNMAGGRDSHETFMSSGIIVFTDAHIAVKNENG